MEAPEVRYWAALSVLNKSFSVEVGQITQKEIDKYWKNYILFEFRIAKQYSTPDSEVILTGTNLGLNNIPSEGFFTLNSYLPSEETIAILDFKTDLDPELQNKVFLLKSGNPLILSNHYGTWFNSFSLLIKVKLPGKNNTKYGNLPNDVIRVIALDLSLPDILNNCLVSQKFNAAICSSEAFWNLKIAKDYPNYIVAGGRTIKEQYMDINNIYNRQLKDIVNDIKTKGSKERILKNIEIAINVDRITYTTLPVFNIRTGRLIPRPDKVKAKIYELDVKKFNRKMYVTTIPIYIFAKNKYEQLFSFKQLLQEALDQIIDYFMSEH